MTPRSDRLCLGTAQFGLDYGVANRTGRIGPPDAEAIVARAYDSGVRYLDTAVAYGESERVLGSIGVSGWSITSKLPVVPSGVDEVGEWVEHQVAGSLRRLGVTRLHAFLLHHPAQLLEPVGPALYDGLLAARAAGRVDKIGISVYRPSELDQLLDRFPIDLIQFPYNVVDRRFADSGWLDRLSGSVELQARSIFLQGLLLMPAEERPVGFRRWKDLWTRWEEWLRREGISGVEGSLGFVMSDPRVDRAVVGVDTLDHLEELLSAVASDTGPPPKDLSVEDPVLVDPSQWSVG